MTEALWDPKTFEIFAVEMHSNELTEVRGVGAEIDGYIPYVSREYSNQFALGLSELIVESTQYAAPRKRLIVLHKAVRQTSFRKPSGVEDLGEPTAIVAVLLCAHQLHIAQARIKYLHASF